MAAQQTLESQNFLTRAFLTLFFGPDPKLWSEAAHKFTKWVYWDQPDGEAVTCWKDRSLSVQRGFLSKMVPWPKAFGKRNGVEVEVAIDQQRLGFTTDIWEGTYQGEPIQMGTTKMRPISYGYISFGVKKFAEIPFPASGKYIHCGDPNIASDRHVMVVHPVTGEVYEAIQFDENAPENPLTNKALGFTRWKDGGQVEGGTSNATNSPMHGFLWGFNSAANPHSLGLVLPDYVGADGTLTQGPAAGDWGFLPAESESYKAMVALGGECEAIAKAANKHGFKIVDRSGYLDAPNTVVGTKLRPSIFWIQWGSYWRKTNIAKLNIPLTDLKLFK